MSGQKSRENWGGSKILARQLALLSLQIRLLIGTAMETKSSKTVIPFPKDEPEDISQPRGEAEARARFGVIAPCAALFFMIIASVVQGLGGPQQGIVTMLSIIGVVLLSGLTGAITALLDTKKFGKKRIYRWSIAGIILGTSSLLGLAALFYFLM